MGRNIDWGTLKLFLGICSWLLLVVAWVHRVPRAPPPFNCSVVWWHRWSNAALEAAQWGVMNVFQSAPLAGEKTWLVLNNYSCLLISILSCKSNLAWDHGASRKTYRNPFGFLGIGAHSVPSYAPIESYNCEVAHFAGGGPANWVGNHLAKGAKQGVQCIHEEPNGNGSPPFPTGWSRT